MSGPLENRWPSQGGSWVRIPPLRFAARNPALGAGLRVVLWLLRDLTGVALEVPQGIARTRPA
jgi:hypothetical protein